MYLMYGAMDGNRLCAMALGNKHAFGLDGVPLDYDQGYGLYSTQTVNRLTESLSKIANKSGRTRNSSRIRDVRTRFHFSSPRGRI